MPWFLSAEGFGLLKSGTGKSVGIFGSSDFGSIVRPQFSTIPMNILEGFFWTESVMALCYAECFAQVCSILAAPRRKALSHFGPLRVLDSDGSKFITLDMWDPPSYRQLRSRGGAGRTGGVGCGQKTRSRPLEP